MNVIELNGLTKSYGKARGIEDVSFHVEEGGSRIVAMSFCEPRSWTRVLSS